MIMINIIFLINNNNNINDNDKDKNNSSVLQLLTFNFWKCYNLKEEKIIPKPGCDLGNIDFIFVNLCST